MTLAAEPHAIGPSAQSQPDAPHFRATLGVLSDVPHWARDGLPPVAYEPYVREMRIWARLFARVLVCAPRAEGPIVGNQAPYEAPNLTWRPLDYSMADGRGAQLARLRQLPGMLRQADALLAASDLVLLRSPGHTALFGRLLARRRRTPTITKWAGFFGAYPGERLTRRAERAMVRRGPDPALVYGPADASHLVSFIPALMTEAELAAARASAARRTWAPPWRLLAVGQLQGLKGFDLALRGLARLAELAPELSWEFTQVGDGPARDELRALAERLGIARRVTFTGALDFDAVRARYAEAHVVIMPGTEEGWPKTIPEAWAHGAVSLGAAAGIVPWLVRECGAGATFEPTPDGLAAALAAVLRAPDDLPRLGAQGLTAVATLSLECFTARLTRLLATRFALDGP